MSHHFATLKLLTIIAEDELEARLIADLKGLGATGYTVLKARGEGAHRARTSEWEGENIQIETLVSADLAERMLLHLAEHYFARFGVVAYLGTVEVLRPGKFVPAARQP